MNNKLQYFLEFLFFFAILVLFVAGGAAGVVKTGAVTVGLFISGILCIIFLKNFIGCFVEEKQRARYERRVLDKTKK